MGVRGTHIHHIGQTGTIMEGDVIEALSAIPDETIDLVFADPPYFLQLENELRRPDDSVVSPVDDEWDRFTSFGEYDRFSFSWLKECRRVLRKDGTLWVIGTYHNIFRIGRILQDLGYWILNDVVWVKSNPMPNFRGTRFTNAHETLIWAKRSKESGYVFNYWDMKSLNDGLQMRSDWRIPICSGRERVMDDGKRAHSTQKPLALLYRVVLSSTVPGSTLLDPFLGSGTTAVAAQMLGRRWIGIEKDPRYIALAAERAEAFIQANASPDISSSLSPHPSRRRDAKVPFGSLVESGMVRAGSRLFSPDGGKSARVNADGSLTVEGRRGSIHQIAALLQGRERANGWDYWFLREGEEALSIDLLRARYREVHALSAAAETLTSPPANIAGGKTLKTEEQLE